MFCKYCGADAEEYKFCPNCGAALRAADGNVIRGPAPAAEQEPACNVKRVNKIAYALIAILLGDFGVHRFYAGKWFSGIMYLLFFWTFIPGLLGLIEGIVALTRVDDGRGNIIVNKGKYFV